MTIRRLPGPPFGFWSNGPDGTGAWLFFEDPPYGTAVAPTVWLPMAPEPPRAPVRRTVFDAGWVGPVAAGTRRSVAAMAVGPSVVRV